MSGEYVGSFPAQVAERPLLRRSSRVWRLHFAERRLLLCLGDMVMLGLALWVGLCLRSSVIAARGSVPRLTYEPHWWFVLWLLWMVVSIIVDCNDPRRTANVVESALLGAAAAASVSLLYLVVPIVSAPLVRSRLGWFLFALGAVVGVGLWRVAYAKLFFRPDFRRRALVVGAGRAGRTLVEAVDALGDATAVEIVGWVDDDVSLLGRRIADHTVLGGSDRLIDLAEQFHVDEIVVTIADTQRIGDTLLRALVSCWERGISIVPMPIYFEEVTGALPIQHIGQNLLTLVDQQNVVAVRLWEAARRVLDIAVGAIGLVLLAPFLPFIALAIYVDSPGPIIYRQERVGRGGQTFWLSKFRTMIPNAERNGAVWAKVGDDRITHVGHLMRKMRLDELPQLWNLLRGDMTLIGPRPERAEFVRQLTARLPYYPIRHAIKPGITGWAQVRYRYCNSMEDSLRKLQYDLYYVKHRSPVLDAIIFLRTIRVVLLMRGT